MRQGPQVAGPIGAADTGVDIYFPLAPDVDFHSPLFLWQGGKAPFCLGASGAKMSCASPFDQLVNTAIGCICNHDSLISPGVTLTCSVYIFVL